MKKIKYPQKNIWLTTDTHFNHAKLIEYGRPANYEDKIRKHLLTNITPTDILIHLGDVCLGNNVEHHNWFKENLKCKTILIQGNHDSKSMSWYLDNGWDIAVRRLDIKYVGQQIAFTHRPIAWDGYFTMNIHGHFHDTDNRRQLEHKDELNRYNRLLALEYTNYQPVLLKTLLEA